jgi:phosphoglycerol geranylgeranyltransferase
MTNVLNYLNSKLKREKLHFTLIDPARQSAQIAADIAKTVVNAGSDAIMVGGSTGVTEELFETTISQIKSVVKVPTIIFPATSKSICKSADAIFFMSLLNSKNIKNVIREQMKASTYIKKIGLEPISMGYIIVEPGMKVGEVGEADLISRTDIKSAISYALAAQYFGMKFVYLEAGSGAPQPVPAEMISAVKSQIDIPLIVGGGIHTPTDVKNALTSGADIIVTGTLIEYAEDLYETIRAIIDVVKEY